MPQEIHVPVDLLARALQLDEVAIDEMRRMLPWWDRRAVDGCETSALDGITAIEQYDALEDERQAADELVDELRGVVDAIHHTATSELRSIKAQLPPDVSSGLGNSIDAAIARIIEVWSLS